MPKKKAKAAPGPEPVVAPSPDELVVLNRKVTFDNSKVVIKSVLEIRKSNPFNYAFSKVVVKSVLGNISKTRIFESLMFDTSKEPP